MYFFVKYYTMSLFVILNKEVCNMKGMKLVVSIVSALVVLAAAVAAVVIFQEELTKFYRDCCDYCKKTFSKKKDEFDDFVDV